AAILDLRGLGQAGIELARQIRRDSPSRPTQLILLIGLDRTIADDRLATLGAFAILAKPARPSELFDCLSSIAAGASDGGAAPFFPRRSRQSPRPQFAARILLAEDNPINQEVAGGMLEAMGCRVVAAPNGQIAVNLFTQESFDLVLMDCEMP